MKKQPLIIPTLSNEDQQRVDTIFKEVEKNMGFIPDGLRLYSISPPILESFLGIIGYFMSHQGLRPELLAMIRYMTSSQAECKFCIDFNEAILVQLGIDLDDIRATKDDVNNAPLENNEIALLKLALQSNDNPETMDEKAMQAAKTLGWTERDIFETVFIAANNRAFTTMLKTFNVEQQGSYS